jgi:hypothetical protein
MTNVLKMTPLTAAFGVGSFAQSQAIDSGGLLNGSVPSSFSNSISELPGDSSFVYSIDNNLPDGVPALLSPIPFTAVAAGRSDDTSALCFRSGSFSNVTLEAPFERSRLYYRSGTTNSGTGASQVDLSLLLNFASPLLTNFTQTICSNRMMINMLNTSDSIAGAEILMLGSPASLHTFTGHDDRNYLLELSFQDDQNATDGSLSDFDKFRAFEGEIGQAVMIGGVTLAPIPEPGRALLIAAAGMALLHR